MPVPPHAQRTTLATDSRIPSWPWLVPPENADPLMVGSVLRGYEWEDGFGRYCLLTDATRSFCGRSRADEIGAILGEFEGLLDAAGFTFNQVIRTWFFLNDILTWYDDFNRGRSKFLGERGLLGRAPASTAVGVFDSLHVDLTAHLLAFRPKSGDTQVEVARSPLQGSALDYGSAFSRATTVRGTAGKRLYVSGTASIDALGNTVFQGDTERQLQETFRVVQALLESHGYGFSDVTLATGYLPNPDDEPLARAIWQRNLAVPPSFTRADICRRDLRFEVELIAERSK